eukprot:TRINITY_DN2412_c0_g1_i1.p1 TRINITY_DN2412_c0_g1~~TRINITY_DN2412_c0_g1_i1.p1  ORF type:complete len:798 (-),score=230.00 TRINITY_DN2412_c0_g1_i1:183-2576(-)
MARISSSEANRPAMMRVEYAEDVSTEDWDDEMGILTQMRLRDGNNKRPIIRLIDYFEHYGPSDKFLCCVFDLVGPPLLKLIRHCRPERVPIPVVKYIVRQLLESLAFLHDQCGVVHANINMHAIYMEQGHVTQEAEMVPGTAGELKRSERHHQLDKANEARYVQRKASGDKAGAGGSKSGSGANNAKMSRAARRRAKMKVKGGEDGKDGADGKDGGAGSGDEKMDTTDGPNDDDGDGNGQGGDDDDDDVEDGERGDNDDDDGDVAMGDADEASIPPIVKDNFKIVLGQMSSAVWAHMNNDMVIQTTQFRAPEVILGCHYDTSADMWSVGCLVYELLTNKYLFQPRESPECTKEEDHLALMMELLGTKMPKKMVLEGKQSKHLFNRKGELRRIRHLQPRDLVAELMKDPRFNRTVAQEAVDFIMPMLEFLPSSRATAAEMLKHPWLKIDPEFDPVPSAMLGWERKEYKARKLPPELELLREQEDERRERRPTEAFITRTIHKQFKTDKHLGSGSFSDVFSGWDIKNQKRVAIKVEVRKHRGASLLGEEANIMKMLTDSEAFPTIHWAGKESRYYVMVMDLMGPSLKKMSFSVRNCLRIAEQLVYAMRDLHRVNYVHLDLKPGNLVMRSPTQVCVLDLGLAQLYRDSNTLKHRSANRGMRLVGNPKYASVNNHRGMTLSRRDDLESIGYVLLHFLRGEVPWSRLPKVSASDRRKQYKPMRKYKARATPEELFKGFPEEFVTYLKTVKGYSYTEEPDYDYLYNLFHERLIREYGNQAYVGPIFDWNGWSKLHDMSGFEAQ